MMVPESHGIQQLPFESFPDPQFYVETSTHSDCMARLMYLLADRGLGVGMLVGSSGTGKTLLMKMIKQLLESNTYHVVSFLTGICTPSDIMIDSLQSLELSPEELTLPSLSFHQLFKHLCVGIESTLRPFGKHLVILIDDAHLMEDNALVTLMSLLNVNAIYDKSLSMVLIGDLSLSQKALRMKPVSSTIKIKTTLACLSNTDVTSYIHQRLSLAGATSPELVFSKEAIDCIQSYALGSPKLINLVCKMGLEQAYLQKKSLVEYSLMKMIIDDIMGPVPVTSDKGGPYVK